MSLFYEDLVVGARLDLGSYTFTREAILAFARRFDPQYFHTDEETAGDGPFGGLAASGWHTAAAWMKLNVQARQRRERDAADRGERIPIAGPSPGFKNLKWPRPVLAGDVVSYAVTIMSKRPTAKPDWGLLFSLGTGENQRGEPVFSFEGCVLVQRRTALER